MIQTAKKVWALFTGSERRKAVVMLVLVVLMAAAETLGVLSIMPFLSVLARPEVVHENRWLQAAYEAFGFHSPRDFIAVLGVASMATVIASALFKTLTLHAVNRFIHLQRHALSSRLLANYLRQPYEFFLSHNPSVLGKNILSEVDQLVFNLLQPVSQLIAHGLVVLAMVALVFWFEPGIAACIVAVVALLYGAIYVLVRRRLGRIGRETQAANARRYQTCNEAIGGIKDVTVTQSAPAYRREFDTASRLYSRHLATGETLAQSPLYLVEATGYTGLIVIALVLLARSNDIAQVLPALGLYGFAAYRLLPAAQIMYRGFAKLKFSAAALDTIHADLQLERSEVHASTAIVPQREIRLEGVRYAYPSAPDIPVIDQLCLVIPANMSIGIIGRSGSGKTTLMDILLGLLRPQHGALSVDGVPITEDNIPAWQRSIGYVPQHIYLADASIAENIAFGVTRADIDMDAVKRAAKAAQIHEFVVSLQHGYDTTVGDRGVRLSGGQRQRIGVARALYRDPHVLLMDEATSALDTQTEEALNNAVRDLSGRKTIVVIAHREASLRYCQQVIRLHPEPSVSAAGPGPTSPKHGDAHPT